MRKNLILLAALVAAPAALPAQTGETPNLIFSISGGLTSGGDLWMVSPQRIPVAPSGTDSFTLSRRLRPGVVAMLSGSYFRNPNLGYTFEAAYFGLATESRCAVLGTYTSDPDNTTQQACTAVQGAHQSTSAVGFQAGLVYRINPAETFSPFVRGTMGFGILGNSYVQTEAEVISSACQPFSSCRFPLLREDRRREFALLGTVAAGFTVSTGPGYKVRLEARDLLAWLPEVTGPTPVQAGPQGTAPQGTRLRHVFVLTAGIDIVLERRHGRRY